MEKLNLDKLWELYENPNLKKVRQTGATTKIIIDMLMEVELNNTDVVFAHNYAHFKPDIIYEIAKLFEEDVTIISVRKLKYRDNYIYLEKNKPKALIKYNIPVFKEETKNEL